MKIEFSRSYKFAHEGIRVVEYGPGVVDVPEAVGKQAIEDGAGVAAAESEESEDAGGEASEPEGNKPKGKGPKGRKTAGDGK